MDQNYTQVLSHWFSLYGGLKWCSLKIFYWEITIITLFIFICFLIKTTFKNHCLKGNIIDAIFLFYMFLYQPNYDEQMDCPKPNIPFSLHFVWSLKKWIMDIKIFCVNYMKFTLYCTDARYSLPLTTTHTKKIGRCHKNWIELDS